MNRSEKKRPNIVLVMSDQHNAHVMGCFGNRVVRTPNLDALARRGVRFTSAYCPYPLCAPSRMGFMTGQYPSEVGVWDNGSILGSHIPTFAHALGAADYHAVLCGRMHFLGHDQFHGFEGRILGECLGYLSAEIRGAGWNRTNGQTKYAVEVAGYGRTGLQAYDREVTDRACEFISQHRRDERPYCLVVGYTLPHNPLICSRELFNYYMDLLPVPDPVSEAYMAELNPAIRRWRERRGVDDLTPQQNKVGLAAYYGLVTEMDQNMGRVMDAVSNSVDSDRTAVIYCTDHGDMAGEHGMWWKSSHYEGSARIPLIFSWPGVWAQDRSVEAVVSLIDVGPTLIGMAGGEPLPGASGRSLAGFIEGGDPVDWSGEIYCEHSGAHGDGPSCMIRREEWKLMYYSELDTHLLFNLDEDPDEMHDRADDPSCRDIARSLLSKIHKRWSAEMMLQGAALEKQRQALLSSCGHPLIPHPLAPPDPPVGVNSFDFSQVPDWETIRKRAAHG